MTASSLPKFVEMPGVSLPVQPPFPFEGMTGRAFPLRASLGSLQRFVDNYLNIMPPEEGRFRVPAPFVTLMMMDYGRMAIEVGNYGWLAQREVLFSIPLEWYKVVNGKWKFHDWATVAPFIYVDDELSMTAGRTVYGWPKTSAVLDPTTNDWLRDPKAPVREALVRTSVFSELYSGKRLEMQPLLEIQRLAPMSLLRMPFDANSPLAPWTIARNLAESVVGLSRDAVGLLSGMGLVPSHPGANADNYLEMMSRIAKVASPRHPDLFVNTINLKQFRSNAHPDQYAYQAVTSAPMRLKAYNGGGLMGEERLLAGDASGGYSVIMHRWPSLPIVQTLGLEVARQYRGPACDVAILKPVAPYWFNVDMEYEPGTNLAWRTHDGVWNGPDRRYDLTVDTPVAAADRLFNTSLGSANRTIAGPFHFTDMTVRVLPLLASKAKLQEFLNSTFNEALSDADPVGPCPMELWAPSNSDFAHVYMWATSIGGVSSGNDNIGDWANYQVAFLIPIRRYEVVDGKPAFRGVGLVSAFTFVDNPTAAAGNSEVLGIPTTSAEFVVSENRWMSLDGPSADVVQSLLQVRAEVLPVVGSGEKAQQRTIIRVEAGRPSQLGEEEEWRSLADTWGRVLKRELRRKQDLRDLDDAAPSRLEGGRRLALELLGNGMPVSFYTLKQFRDVAEPYSACYQSFARVQRTLAEVHDLREIEEPLTVFLHDYPTRPVVQMLGLVAQQIPGHGEGIVYGLQPQRPFWLTATMDESLGQGIRHRAGGNSWRAYPGAAVGSFMDEAHDVQARVGHSATTMLDQGDARRLTRAAIESTAIEHATPATGGVSEELSADSLLLDPLLDPQSVLESILSREWGNHCEDARWRVGRRALENRYVEELAGVSEGGRSRMEQQFFRKTLAEAGSRPGESAATAAEAMIIRLKEFSDTLQDLENAWEQLAVQSGRSAIVGEVPDPPPTAITIAQARLAFLKLVDKIGTLDIQGIADSPAKPADFRPAQFVRMSDDHARMGQLLGDEYTALAAVVGRVLNPGDAEHRRPSPNPNNEGKSRRSIRFPLEPSYLARQLMHLQNAGATAESTATLRDDSIDRRDTMRDLVRLARERCDMQRQALFNKLARTSQKPDHVIWRGATGTERDRIFPLAESWDEAWYVGTGAPIPDARPQSPDEAPSKA